MYPNYYGGSSDVAPIICFIIAICGGITAYFLFISQNETKRYHGFVLKLHEFLNFKTLLVETIFKILYVILAIFVTLVGLFNMKYSFLGGLFIILMSNIFLRIAFEFALLKIIICKNTTDIKNKLWRMDDATELFKQVPGRNPQVNRTVVNQPVESKPVESKPVESKPVVKETAYCSNCGAVVKEGDLFCANCGQKLK